MMRTMPTILSDGSPVPSVSAAEFNRRLEEIASRPLTEAELARVERMAAHNWTLRVIAEELFGSDVVAPHFAPAE